MHFTEIIVLFVLGIVAGMSIALPYGPVGFLIIRRFYLFGMKSGMYSTLGMALSDALYAVIVGFGLHDILHFVSSIAVYAEFALGFLVIYIGIRSMKRKLELQIDEEQKHPTRDIASAFFINILNPSLVFWFALAFSLLGKILHERIEETGAGIFIIGITCGACFLWFLIGEGIHYLRRKNKDELVQKINTITGAILMVIGIVILLLAIIQVV